MGFRFQGVALSRDFLGLGFGIWRFGFQGLVMRVSDFLTCQTVAHVWMKSLNEGLEDGHPSCHHIREYGTD